MIAASRTIAVAGAASLAFLASAGSAFAQALPGPVAPGRIEQQLQPQPGPRATEPSVLPQLPEGVTAPAGAETVHFILRGLQIDGIAVYPADEFAPLYRDLVGTDITLARVYMIAAAVTARYRGDGYILSQAVVPAQRIGDGTVRLRVVEGFVDHVIVEGAARDAAPTLIDDYGRKIAASRPLRAADLERYLLLMNDLPGVSAQAFLHASATVPGAADLSLVLDRKPVSGYANFDNRGSRFVGPYIGQVGASLNDLLGLYEQTGLRVVGAARLRELQYVEASHDEQLDTEGTRLHLTAYRGHSRPGGALAAQDIDELNYTGLASVSHPFIRSRSQNLSAHGGIDIVNTDVDQSTALLASDRLRVLRLGASYDFVDTLLHPAVNLVAAEVSRGLDAFGASKRGSPFLSRPNGQAEFTKVTFDATRQQPLTDHIALVLAATGQYAANSLLSSEQFGFGGAQFGRGYDPSQLIGDSGIAGKIELQYADAPGLAWLQSYQFYTFYDAGRVFNREALQIGQTRHRSGTSTGVGLRSNVTEWASGFVEFAQKLTSSAANAGESGDGARFFFGLTTRF